jgi:hypothetical protein
MISASTRVHLVAFTQNGKCWLSKVATGRNKRGDIVLTPTWDDDPSQSQSVPFEHALIFQRRLKEESNVTVRFALSAGESADLIEEREADVSPGGRTPTPFKGLLVRPYNPRGWCVRLVRDGAQLESVKGETVEETADKVIERNLFQYAEKAPVPPPPEPSRTQQAPYRKKPGSI